MAIGDKYPVLMGKDKDVPDGVATLDAEGILKKSQRPNLAQVGGSNPNLLDNWYFAGDSVIDQRQGAVVPPGVQCYSDPELTTPATNAVTTSYVTVVELTSTYAKFTTSTGNTYYVPASAAVRGYGGSGYMIDRWVGNNLVLKVNENVGLINTSTNTNVYFRQYVHINLDAAQGLPMTFSMLTSNNELYVATGNYNANASSSPFVQRQYPEYSLSMYGKYSSRNATLVAQIAPRIEDTELNIVAVKLELGSIQTLARLDENGNWVLNDPPPNPATELAKCQRYYQLFSTAEKRPTTLTDYRPTMRANPTTGTINVNGQTLYYADANL